MERTSALLGALIIPVLFATTRAQDPVIQAALNAVNSDTLVRDLRQLSGELAVDLGNGEQFITSRNSSNAGNQLASDWLQQRAGFLLGQAPNTQNFSDGGQNVYIYKLGLTHPGRKVVICGHYDAMPGGPVAAPAADDDGSGTVSVLEAMRVLAPYSFENTLCFAMWDKEEQGLLGSDYFASTAAGNDDTLIAVINMDAIGYDSNGDRHMKVHTKPIGNSLAIKDTALMVNSLYGIDLPITVQNPGATYSDHKSFWDEGYGAILIIEDFENDGNPHYHTSSDLVQYMDTVFWADLTRLSIATAATIAVPYSANTGISEPVMRSPRLSVHPNPTSGATHVRVRSDGGYMELALLDGMGRHLLDLAHGVRTVGEHTFDLDAESLVPGAYLVRLSVNGHVTTWPLVRMP